MALTLKGPDYDLYDHTWVGSKVDEFADEFGLSAVWHWELAPGPTNVNALLKTLYVKPLRDALNQPSGFLEGLKRKEENDRILGKEVVIPIDRAQDDSERGSGEGYDPRDSGASDTLSRRIGRRLLRALEAMVPRRDDVEDDDTWDSY